MVKLRDKIFRHLKSNDGANIEQIAYVLKESKKDILLCLDEMVKKGWVVRSNGGFHIVRVLGKPLKPLPENKYWKYETLQKGVEQRPKRFLNPYFTQIPHLDQDGRGTCVGMSAAYAAQFLQYKLNNVTPQNLEEPVERDKQVNIGPCVAIFDIYPDHMPSQQGLYDDSREYGNIDAPEGSYVEAVVGCWKDWGYNFEKDRQTSKTNFCVVPYYPLKGTQEETIKFLKEQAKDHRLDGYARITSWDGLKDAVWKYGCALVAINIFENYGDGNYEGNFPDPRGDVIGSHAMCVIGYDDDLDEVYVIHSWGKAWTKIGGFSRRYHDMATGSVFALLDSSDVIVADEKYAKVEIHCNTPCTLQIGEDIEFNILDYTAMLEIGKEYVLTATPVDYRWYGKEPQTVSGAIPKTRWTVYFDFPKKSISKYIADLIVEILKKILKIN